MPLTTLTFPGNGADFFRSRVQDSPLLRQTAERIGELAQSFTSWDSLKAQYFSLGGFLIGLIFVFLLFCANTRKGEKPIRGMLGVLLAVAVVNSCSALWLSVLKAYPDGWNCPRELVPFFQTENLICGCILTLVLHSNYRNNPWAGATFALVTRLAMVMLHWQELEGILHSYPDGSILGILLGQGVLMYFLGAIIARRKYISTGWLWYAGYQAFPLVMAWLVLLVRTLVAGGGVLDALSHVHRQLAPHVPDLTPGGILFVLVLVAAILFDTSILAAGARAQKETGA